MKSILTVLSTAILGVMLWEAPAFCQSYAGWQNLIPPNQLDNFNNYLAQHPTVAAFLNTDPNAANYNGYLRSNPGFGQFLTANPNLRNYLGQNPGWFAQRQQAYFSRYGFNPTQTLLLDGFLKAHPAIAQALDRNPGLAGDAHFLAAHPELAKFLKRRPGIASRLRSHPWMWSPKKRYTQRNWWLDQDRDHDGDGYAARHHDDGEEAEEREEASEEYGEHEGRHRHHDEDDDRDFRGDHGRHLGWYKHHQDRDDDDEAGGHGRDHD